MYHLVQKLTVDAVCSLETLVTLIALNDAATLRATICINICLRQVYFNINLFCTSSSKNI